jgi:AcrR family transcriptional regulator
MTRAPAAQRPKYTRRRIQILRSAAAAFRRRGYHGASVDEIASALQMTKGNLYYYFRNKEEILYVCHDYSLDIMLGILSEVEALDTTPDQKLRRLVEAFVHVIIDELHGTALTIELQALSPELLGRIIRKRDRFDRGVRRIVQAGMDAGIFQRGDAKLVAFAVLGAINWIPRWFDPGGAKSSAQIGRAFADYLVGGLLADNGARPAIAGRLGGSPT